MRITAEQRADMIWTLREMHQFNLASSRDTYLALEIANASYSIYYLPKNSDGTYGEEIKLAEAGDRPGVALGNILKYIEQKAFKSLDRVKKSFEASAALTRGNEEDSWLISYLPNAERDHLRHSFAATANIEQYTHSVRTLFPLKPKMQ